MKEMIDFTEIEKLHKLLTEAGIPHIYQELYDGRQIRIYADEDMTNEIDDAVIHSGSHGNQNGLLETYTLSECEGWETAEQVFKGWQKMYTLAKGINRETAECTMICAGGEIWEGSMPSWE